MAQSIKLGSDTYLDASGVWVNGAGKNLESVLGGAQFNTKNIPANSSVTLNCPSSGKALLYTVGGSAGATGEWLINTASNGTSAVFDVRSASGISFTTGTNTITITNSTTGTPRAMIFGVGGYTFA